uniref:Uncharacterized protein n=1 Tax=Arundo donax TaxID=35708 RepID=A0A0A8ZI79_ARUDO
MFSHESKQKDVNLSGILQPPISNMLKKNQHSKRSFHATVDKDKTKLKKV